MIQAERVSKLYKSDAGIVTALDAISLRIASGAFVALTGASGSGKTTLMNLIGLLDTPSSGSLQFDGQEVGALSADSQADLRNRRIGFVFQAYSLLARSTAIENVELPLIYAGIGSAERRSRAAAALAQVGLENRCHHWPTQLSGGEQQRVAIARACVTQPSLILADEPTGALDSRTGHEILQLFQSLNNNGTAILLVTHDREIAAFAQRRIELKDGRILHDRTACHEGGLR